MVKLSRLFLQIIAIIIFISCNNVHDNSIGQSLDENFVLNDAFKDSLTGAWNTMLAKDSIKGKISDLKLITANDLKTREIYYSILGETTTDSAKVACSVILKDKKFYLEESDVSTAIICFGSKKCTPKMYNGRWVCDDGTGKESCSRDCMKKTVSTLLF